MSDVVLERRREKIECPLFQSLVWLMDIGGYGMVLAEALARGLPIVACAGGAVAETVPQGAGLLVAPGDSRALRDALARLIRDLDFRVRLQAGARRRRRTLPTWQEASEQFAIALRAVVAT